MAETAKGMDLESYKKALAENPNADELIMGNDITNDAVNGYSE